MLRRLLVIVVAAGSVLMPMAQAWAGGGGGVTVACGSDPSPGCVLGAHDPGQGSGAANPVKAQPGDTTTDVACRDISGQVQPCVDPAWGWMGSDGCYYKLDTSFQPPAWDSADQPPPGQLGAFYDMNCAVHVNIHGTGGGIVWLPSGVAPGSVPPPVVLAEQARNELTLPAPRIELSPAGQQLVNLATWLWIAPMDYSTQSATAAVPGESVTATATAQSVSWSLGDGTRLTCMGPGTAYTTGDDPASASPTCGHTYRSSSAGQPAGAFAVTATVHWTVAWAGAGQAGTFPELTTTATVQVPVAESQALTTN